MIILKDELTGDTTVKCKCGEKMVVTSLAMMSAGKDEYNLLHKIYKELKDFFEAEIKDEQD